MLHHLNYHVLHHLRRHGLHHLRHHVPLHLRHHLLHHLHCRVLLTKSSTVCWQRISFTGRHFKVICSLSCINITQLREDWESRFSSTSSYKDRKSQLKILFCRCCSALESRDYALTWSFQDHLQSTSVPFQRGTVFPKSAMPKRIILSMLLHPVLGSQFHKRNIYRLEALFSTFEAILDKLFWW